MSKPSVPKGTRDFQADEMLRREFIFETIRSVFRLYGYQPIETPAMEHLSTLLGKYGEEGDRLIFRILNSGDFLAGINDGELLERETGRLASRICEKGLRYDLTVPFARFVVQHRNKLVFPFRRYQIQPVWRADRPQKGRYREFFQCDADVIGSDSLLNEYELVRIIEDVFSGLGLRAAVSINNRKILAGLAEYIGEGSRLTDITVAIDKLEKAGYDAVYTELKEKGISGEAINKLQPVLRLQGDTAQKLNELEILLAASETGIQGITEMKTLFSLIEGSEPGIRIVFDLTLARGLNYYTGTIIEVKSEDIAMGSICGGGRYDNLTGIFGLDGVSGVGISFGADRIYDVMLQLGLFEKRSPASTRVMVINFGEKELPYARAIADRLRSSGISTELYPDPVRLGKQFAYAGSRGIPYVVIAGEEEIEKGECTLRVMETGEQKRIVPGDIGSHITI
jgi:histidyl-tRNA synthetase